MKTFLLLCMIIISVGGYSQKLQFNNSPNPDTNYFKHAFRTIVGVPRTGTTSNGDVKMIDMPAPVLIYGNKANGIYEQPMDGMRYLSFKPRSNMPVLKSR